MIVFTVYTEIGIEKSICNVLWSETTGTTTSDPLPYALAPAMLEILYGYGRSLPPSDLETVIN